MNREEIEKAANAKYEDNTFAYKGFIEGAEWRINSVWRDASKERPERDRYYLATVEIPGKPTIIAIWKDDYRGQANHPFFKRWAYPEDFMTERKEETK